MTPEHTPHPMEDRLRRYAQMRRQQAGAPFELHPADKEALLAEARRVYEAEGRRRPVLWGRWTSWAAPRWAMAAALVAALGVALYSVWRMDRPLASAPERNLVLHKAPEGTVARTASPANAPADNVGELRQAEALAPPTRDLNRAAQLSTGVAADTMAGNDPLRTRRALPAAEPEKQDPMRQPPAATVAESAVDAASSRAMPPAPEPAKADRFAAKTVPPVKEEAAPAVVAAAPPPREEAAARRSPVVAMRGAPGGVGEAYGTQAAALQAVTVEPAAPAPEARVAPPPPAPKAVQSLAEFYLAQQAAMRERPAAGLAESSRASETGRAAVPAAPPPAAPVPQVMARRLPPPTSSQASKAAAVENKGVVLLSFVVTGEPNEGTPRPAAFRFWTSNNVVRVVDADGTVYEGEFTAIAQAQPAPAASRRQTLDKAGARELLAAPARKAGPPPPQQDGVSQGPRTFLATGRHPRLQQEVQLSGEWPPAEDGLLRLQLRVGNGPAQTFLARPAEN